MRRFVPLPSQLIAFIAERLGGFDLEEVIEAGPEEGSWLLDDSFVRYEHFPQLRQLFVSVKLALIVLAPEVVARVRRRASWKLVFCFSILILNQILQSIIFVHHLVVVIRDDIIVVLSPGGAHHLDQGKSEDVVLVHSFLFSCFYY